MRVCDVRDCGEMAVKALTFTPEDWKDGNRVFDFCGKHYVEAQATIAKWAESEA